MVLFLFLNFWLILFNTAVIAPIFNPIVDFVIPIGTPSKEAKAEFEVHPVIVEAKMRKCSV